MELLEVLDILKEIDSTSKKNEKTMLLYNNKSNLLLLNTLKYLLNDQIVGGISKKKIVKKVPTSNELVGKRFDEVLDYLIANSTGTDKTIGAVRGYLDSLELSEEYVAMLEGIITKRTMFGISDERVNKIWGKDTIPVWKFMKGDSFEKHEHKVKGNFYLTKKMDGNRVFVTLSFNHKTEKFDITYKTKQGAVIEGMEYLNNQILHLMLYMPTLTTDMVFDGEILATDDGTMTTNELYRKTQTLIKKKGKKSGMDYHIYDFAFLKGFSNGVWEVPYDTRRDILEATFLNVDKSDVKNINLLPVLYYGEDPEQIKTWSDYADKQGWEGIMLNLESGFYECKRVSHLLKVKKFYYSDILVLDVYEGDKKNTGKLGGVVIQFKDFTTKVGSGFSDEERIKFWENPELIIGKIMTVRYFEETENSKEGKGLRFASFKGVREDKTIADISYES